MPRLTIDNLPIDVPPGSTVLDAARRLGIDIPALCYLEGHPPMNSCMLCLVRIRPSGRLMPSCATPAAEGMEVESETPEIRALRRTGLELLLSDHAGDCTAPCQNTCPVRIDLPVMLRQVAAGEWGEAIMTIRRELALPAVLGRVCGEYCEKGCRRAQVDSAASICLVKRAVADRDLASDRPWLPPRGLATGKRVAIIGAGPAGLSAAYHLLIAGHACDLFEARPAAGGMLRYETDEAQLPRPVLDAEIALIETLGARIHLGRSIESVHDLRRDYDAVLVATGPVDPEEEDVLGLAVAEGRIESDHGTHEAGVPGVFAAGDVARLGRIVVRAVADGKAAAEHIDQYLLAGRVIVKPRPFTVRLGRVNEGELAELAGCASAAARVEPAPGAAGLTPGQAQVEASRCLGCDCISKDDCRLRYYAQLYGVVSNRFRGVRRQVERHHRHGEVVYEPGKCIMCGLCIEVAGRAGEALGLTFVGRGFDVRVDVPLDRPLSEGLREAALACAAVCPSGALVAKGAGGCSGCGGACPGGHVLPQD
jgi:ferredoxin